jgi:hypothetical protein
MSQNSASNGPVEILNCQKPAGIESLRQNRIAIKAIERQTGLEFLSISDQEPSRIDGFIFDPAKGIITGIYEVKTRSYGLHKLQTTFGNEWMISWSKIQAALEVTRRTKLPFYGVLHLLDDNIVMMVEIFNRNASWAANHKVEDRLVNGIKDRMALINMATAMHYKMNQIF